MFSDFDIKSKDWRREITKKVLIEFSSHGDSDCTN